jgi:hypothetical protein
MRTERPSTQSPLTVSIHAAHDDGPAIKTMEAKQLPTGPLPTRFQRFKAALGKLPGGKRFKALAVPPHTYGTPAPLKDRKVAPRP